MKTFIEPIHDKEISQAYKEELDAIMKAEKIGSSPQFILEKLTKNVIKKHIMNEGIMKELPTDTNELWDLSRKLGIYRKFKAFVLGITTTIKVERGMIMRT